MECSTATVRITGLCWLHTYSWVLDRHIPGSIFAGSSLLTWNYWSNICSSDHATFIYLTFLDFTENLACPILHLYLNMIPIWCFGRMQNDEDRVVLTWACVLASHTFDTDLKVSIDSLVFERKRFETLVRLRCFFSGSERCKIAIGVDFIGS